MLDSAGPGVTRPGYDALKLQNYSVTWHLISGRLKNRDSSPGAVLQLRVQEEGQGNAEAILTTVTGAHNFIARCEKRLDNIGESPHYVIPIPRKAE